MSTKPKAPETSNPTVMPELLCKSSFFEGLSAADINTLNEFTNVITLSKSEVLFKEGEVPTGLYNITKGKIKVYRTGNEGKEQIVRLSNQGDLVGYRALIGHDDYRNGAATLEETTVCFIPKDIVLRIMEDNSVIYKRIIQLLSDDLRYAEQKIKELAQKPVRERVADALLQLKDKYGFEKDGATINITMSREELANLVGTATETLIRILSDFKKDRMIDLDHRKIKVLNSEQLIRTAHLYD
jgi:CRP/FNR family transcriptional regulator, polysaccharide utilization system transcription regulator